MDIQGKKLVVVGGAVVVVVRRVVATVGAAVPEVTSSSSPPAASPSAVLAMLDTWKASMSIAPLTVRTPALAPSCARVRFSE